MDFYVLIASTFLGDSKFDVIFVDLASSSDSVNGLCCPPPQFVAIDTLQKMRQSLSPERQIYKFIWMCFMIFELKKYYFFRGVLAFNLVTRDNDIANNAKKDVLRYPY